MRADAIDSLFRYLPIRVVGALNGLPQGILSTANEIRLRKNAPVSITVGTKNLSFDPNGRICNIKSGMRIIEAEMLECIERLTEGSVYSYDEYLKKGFVPLVNGARAGICGRASPSGGWSEIYSINLRISRFVPNAAVGLIKAFSAEGIRSTLVCSPPALGKTTFLKSVAYLLSHGIGLPPIRVGIADERGEIFSGISNNGLIDPCAFLPKAQGIELLTRVMSPEVIVCDEISANEVDAIAEAHNGGVALIASAHCVGIGDLLMRGRMKTLADPSVFPVCVMLGYDGGYVCSVHKTEELL
jgi:stage III sporulation protein AA